MKTNDYSYVIAQKAGSFFSKLRPWTPVLLIIIGLSLIRYGLSDLFWWCVVSYYMIDAARKEKWRLYKILFTLYIVGKFFGLLGLGLLIIGVFIYTGMWKHPLKYLKYMGYYMNLIIAKKIIESNYKLGDKKKMTHEQVNKFNNDSGYYSLKQDMIIKIEELEKEGIEIEVFKRVV